MLNSQKKESLSLKKPLKSSKNIFSALPSFVDNEDKARIYIYQNDKNSRNLSIILNKYKPFILKHSRKFFGYLKNSNIFDESDLIAEAKCAFINALNKFDFKEGSSLSSYAIFYIDGALKEFILNNSQDVKISNSGAFKHLFFKLNKIKDKCNAKEYLNDCKKVKKIEKLTEVSEKQINSILNVIQSKSLNYNEDDFKNEGENESSNSIFEIYKSNPNVFGSVQINIENKSSNAFRKKTINKFLKLLQNIDIRQEEIIRERYFNKKYTLLQLSKIYRLSPQRISYIEKQALKNLKKIFIENNFNDVEISNLLTN